MKLNNFFYDKMMRAPDGNPAPAGNETPVEPAVEPVVEPVVEPAADYSFLPGDFLKDGKPDVAGFTAHYQDIVARDAQAAERLSQIPEAYDFKPSEGLKFDGLDLPEGFSVNPMTDDPAMQPLFEEMGSLLKDLGAPAESAGKVSDLLAKYEAVKYSQAHAAQKAELSALGTPAQQQARFAAIERSLQSKLPATQVAALQAATTTAEGIKALEALLRPSGHQSPAPQPGGVDTEGMTPYQRLQHANTQKA